MLIAIVRFPPIPTERDADFRSWFAWSNDELRDVDGLVGRRLLRGGDGAYVGLIEHDSPATFEQMHAGPTADKVQLRLHELLGQRPHAETFDVVGAPAEAGCCGGHDEVEAGDRVEVVSSAPGGCCGGVDSTSTAGASAVAAPAVASCRQ